MATLSQKITEFDTAFSTDLSQANTLSKLEEVRLKYLARKALLAQLMDELKSSSLEEKQKLGPLLNDLKNRWQQAFDEKYNHLHAQEIAAQQRKKEYFDVTAYRVDRKQGSLHPLTHITRKATAIFDSMGYTIIDGPEVETEFYNFDALNIAADHPARDLWDTLWLDVPGLLLRTHTSPAQVHAMQNTHAPLAVVAPGRCYRHEATDATHDFMFMQIEGLLVDKDIALSHLLATISAFVQAFFERKKLEIRVRPSYFPFVEPGIEIDIECPFCNHGCSVCKETEWIETGGAGLVHPNVLEMSGIDPKQFSGFAFGFGLTRLAMLQYAIPDIRLLHENNIEFLKQF